MKILGYIAFGLMVLLLGAGFDWIFAGGFLLIIPAVWAWQKLSEYLEREEAKNMSLPCKFFTIEEEAGRFAQDLEKAGYRLMPTKNDEPRLRKHEYTAWFNKENDEPIWTIIWREK